MKAVYALFEAYDRAEAAVHDLLDQGFDQEDMNVIVQDSVVRNRTEEDLSGSREGRTLPALRGMLAGERSIPAVDTGGILAAGQRATILADTAARPDGPGVEGQLREFGMDEEAAEAYLGGIKGGGLLFWIITDDDHAHDAADILGSHEAGRVLLNPAPRRKR